MIVLCNPRLLALLSGSFAGAMALWPFIVVRKPTDRFNASLMNHERIHLRQQVELLVVPFYVWYALEYLLRRLHSNGHLQAYQSIGFEREAIQNELDPDYLSHRKPYAFLRCLRGKAKSESHE
ncbi:MAG: hypothetical protein KBF37_07785 [Saprospiraceae bacterium]|jgi:hypothetical protein|nr:hypothetical protein [Saprospiraceae bacterium]MBP9210203.1 hypothetical protein [Saprospiraceae bacterium]